MTSLLERFSQPLPGWVDEINHEVFQRVSAGYYAKECRSGNINVVREIIYRFWPFIDAFPGMVNRGCLCLLKEDLFTNYGVGLVGLLRTGFSFLMGMEKDEENHRSLWLKSAGALGLSRGDLQQMPILEIETIIQSVGEDADPFTMLLRFVTVEIVAESVSKDFLSSREFVSALGAEGTHWFRAHVGNAGMNHEELALRLVQSLHDKEMDKDGVSAVIQPMADLFITAGEKCAELAMVKQDVETSHP